MLGRRDTSKLLQKANAEQEKKCLIGAKLTQQKAIYNILMQNVEALSNKIEVK